MQGIDNFLIVLYPLPTHFWARAFALHQAYLSWTVKQELKRKKDIDRHPHRPGSEGIGAFKNRVRKIN